MLKALLESLFERFRSHDRRALARLLTYVANGQYSFAVLHGVGPPAKPSRVVAITGSGGVGKSTLVGKLIEHVRGRGQTVAVLACDPESPLSGGALLGDRFRMPPRADDDGVYIRSLAAAPGHGAVAEHLHAMIGVLEAFGFDVVLIETVGAGQGDTAVRGLADVVLLLLQPETGDDLQWEKAGVFEIADVIAIHKADLPGAANTEAHVHAVLGLVPGPQVDVVRVSSRTGEGIDKLWDAVAARALRRSAPPSHEPDWQRFAETVLRQVIDRAKAVNPTETQRILSLYERGIVCPSVAAHPLLDLLAKPPQESPAAQKGEKPHAP